MQKHFHTEYLGNSGQKYIEVIIMAKQHMMHGVGTIFFMCHSEFLLRFWTYLETLANGWLTWRTWWVAGMKNIELLRKVQNGVVPFSPLVFDPLASEAVPSLSLRKWLHEKNWDSDLYCNENSKNLRDINWIGDFVQLVVGVKCHPNTMSSSRSAFANNIHWMFAITGLISSLVYLLLFNATYHKGLLHRTEMFRSLHEAGWIWLRHPDTCVA